MTSSPAPMAESEPQISSEAAAIAATSTPVTIASLVTDLHALGVEEGDVMIVHTSLSRLGWVVGGAQAVVMALLAAVGQAGTVVMPTQSSGWSDPARWMHPPVPAEWVDVIRTHMPPFDPALTPTREMGQVVECFRHHRATIRSSHPMVSFAANGPRAPELTADHAWTPGLGEGSPLSRLYDLDAKVLLLGVTHANDTSLHLAEHRATWPGKATYTEGSPSWENGRRVWRTFEDLLLDEGDFEQIGEAFAASGAERIGPVGAGIGRLSRQRAIVDFGVAWMNEHRT